jgi:translation elongation factor EF-G
MKNQNETQQTNKQNQNETQYRKHNHIQFDVKPQKIGKYQKTKKQKRKLKTKTKTKQEQKINKTKTTWCNTIISERKKNILWFLLGNCCVVLLSDVKVAMRS